MHKICSDFAIIQIDVNVYMAMIEFGTVPRFFWSNHDRYCRVGFWF
jgi:hypothetical protein